MYRTGLSYCFLPVPAEAGRPGGFLQIFPAPAGEQCTGSSFFWHDGPFRVLWTGLPVPPGEKHGAGEGHAPEGVRMIELMMPGISPWSVSTGTRLLMPRNEKIYMPLSVAVKM